MWLPIRSFFWRFPTISHQCGESGGGRLQARGGCPGVPKRCFSWGEQRGWMGFNGFWWVLMGLNGVEWVLMGFNGFWMVFEWVLKPIGFPKAWNVRFFVSHTFWYRTALFLNEALSHMSKFSRVESPNPNCKALSWYFKSSRVHPPKLATWFPCRLGRGFCGTGEVWGGSYSSRFFTKKTCQTMGVDPAKPWELRRSHNQQPR